MKKHTLRGHTGPTGEKGAEGHLTYGPWEKPNEYELTHAAVAYNTYVQKWHGYRCPEVEDIIATNPEYAYKYAMYAIKGKWLQGEDAIYTDPTVATAYVIHVLGKKRCRRLEKLIWDDPINAFNYAMHVIGGRWRKAEPYIASSDMALYYATHIMKGRFPQGESNIALQGWRARPYISSVLKFSHKYVNFYLRCIRNGAVPLSFFAENKRGKSLKSEGNGESMFVDFCKFPVSAL